MKYLAALAVLMPSISAGGSYDDNASMVRFTAEPCSELFSILDGDAPDPLMVGMQGAAKDIGDTGMIWGFVLGFDAAHGGLQKGEKTALMRARSACRDTPDQPLADILSGLTE